MMQHFKTGVFIQAPGSVVDEAKRLAAQGLYRQALHLLEANSLRYTIFTDRMIVCATASRENQAALLRRKRA